MLIFIFVDVPAPEVCCGGTDPMPAICRGAVSGPRTAVVGCVADKVLSVVVLESAAWFRWMTHLCTRSALSTCVIRPGFEKCSPDRFPRIPLNVGLAMNNSCFAVAPGPHCGITPGSAGATQGTLRVAPSRVLAARTRVRHEGGSRAAAAAGMRARFASGKLGVRPRMCAGLARREIERCGRTECHATRARA